MKKSPMSDREEFLKIVPAPTFVMVEVFDDNEPCTSMDYQMCRVLRLDPAYKGPIDPGAIVVLRSQARAKHFQGEGRPVALLPIDYIVGVVKQ